MARTAVPRIAHLRLVILISVCLVALFTGRSDVHAAAFNSTGTGDWTSSLGGTPGASVSLLARRFGSAGAGLPSLPGAGATNSCLAPNEVHSPSGL